MDPTGKGDQPELEPERAKQYNESYDEKGDRVPPETPWKTSG
ncbi:hypothetical protein [Nocardia inohanensis]|nr:hypothetical protein [Nocardia inohanensis]